MDLVVVEKLLEVTCEMSEEGWDSIILHERSCV